jgi:predicted phosphate transport protein (TIGR00153 family)
MKIFKKEKEVANLALEYLETATRCVSVGQSTVIAYLNGEIEKAAAMQRETADLESAADTARRSIGDRMYSGAYMPLIRGDIYSLIESLDKVPNAAEACTSFFLSEKPQVPDEFKEAFVAVTEESYGTMAELHKAVKTFFKPKGDIEKIRGHAKEVGVRESRVDDMEWVLAVAIFDSEKIDLSQKLHLRTALSRIVHLSDVAENSADRLELASLKSVL